MTTRRVVVVGASVGGVRTAQGLRLTGFDGDITVIGAEDEVPYDKPPLSKQVLTGEQMSSDIRLASLDEMAASGITTRLGTAAGSLRVQQRRVELVDGTHVDYDALVIATGVRPRQIGSPDDHLVLTLRSLADAHAIRERLLSTGGPLVVIGGGFIGAEIASSARSLGIPTTVIEAMPSPFSRVLGATVAPIVERLHTERGVTVIAGTGVAGVQAHGAGAQVVLEDGQLLDAGVVVAGIGCVPNTEWLIGSGLPVDNGVLTDASARVVGAPGVYALGDVARSLDPRSGQHLRIEHWTHTTQQAQMVAHNITYPDDLQVHTKAPYFWSDQHGVKIQLAGRHSPEDDVEVLTCPTPMGDREVALYSRDGAFTAGVSFGWPQLVPRLRRMWESGATLAQARAVVSGTAL